MITKKHTRRSIVSPVLVSVLATVAVFVAAEYMFHIPSRFFLTEETSVVGGQTQRNSWNTVIATGSDDEHISQSGGELVLWPSFEGEVSEGVPVQSGTILNKTGSVTSGDTGDKVDKNVSCTLEYFPVCGADGKTYSNSCMANRAKTIVAHEGNCASGAPAVSDRVDNTVGESETGELMFDTGSYVLYKNASYSFYLPKYAYYAGYGAQGGAAHTLAVGLSATGTDTFDTADIRVSFYRTEPAEAPIGKKIVITNGVLYVEGDMSNAKITKIIDVIGASAK